MLKLNWKNNQLLLLFIWIIAIAIRLYGTGYPAQLYDIATFEAWSRAFWIHGPLAFFGSVWSDYLPLPILTFAPISLLADLLHVPFDLLFKFVHSFLELLLIALLPSSYFLPKLLLLLSPALIGDTSFWGQVDTLPALLALLSLTSSSGVLLGLAVAYKPIMILIAPIIWINSLKKGENWWRLPLVSSIIFFVTAIPTGGLNFLSHIFARIFAQAGTYPYLTINAFNFWSLVPNLSWISDSTSVFSLSGRTFGLIIFSFFTLNTLNLWRKSNFSPNFASRVAATILILFYTFTTRMHERHLLFGLPFLTLAVAGEIWLLMPLLLLTFTFSLNLYGAYYWVNHSQVWPFSISIISLISWVNVLTSISLAMIWDWSSFIQKLTKTFSKNKMLILILLLSTLLRFVNLSYPQTYIFDEVYHAFTSREFLNNHVQAWEWWTTPPEGVAYEWTHPPVAKYGMVAGMLLFGENSFGWRVGSATFGVVSILGLYLLVLTITKEKSIALLSAFLVSIEGIHIAQSRIAMNDIYMLCFFVWSLYCAIKSRWKLAAVLYGLALGSKWSALYGIVPLFLIYLNQKKISLHSVIFIFQLLIITILVYVLTFSPFILAGHTWAQWWELHRQMWYYHTHLVATHGYQSTPLQWLFDARPVWYYVNYLENSISNIYVHGNPLILWLGLVAVILQLRYIFKFQYFIFYILYFSMFIPWIISPRIMFFYHYLPSSVFLCVILSSWLGALPKTYKYIFVLLAICSTLIISPMLYGIPLPHSYWNTFFAVFPSWK